MQVGPLRHRVTIRTATTVDDGQGGQVVTWTDTATVWAAIDPRQGREGLQAQAIQNATLHRIQLRYRDDVTVKTRIYVEPDGPTCEVVEVLDPGRRHVSLELLASEVDA